MKNDNDSRVAIANILLDNLEKYRPKILDIIVEHWAHPNRNDFGDVLEYLENLGEINPFDSSKYEQQ